MRPGLGTLGLIAPRDVITHFRGFDIPWTIEPDLEIISGATTATVSYTIEPDLEIISGSSTASVAYTIQPNAEILTGSVDPVNVPYVMAQDDFTPSYVTDGLLLYYDVGKTLSYSGTGDNIARIDGSSPYLTARNPGRYYLTNPSRFVLVNGRLLTQSHYSGLNSFTTSSNFTVEIWAYSSANGNGGTNEIINKHVTSTYTPTTQDYRFYQIYTDNTFPTPDTDIVRVGNESGYVSVGSTIGQYFQIAASFDYTNKIMRVYRNGAEVGTMVLDNTPITNNGQLYIGAAGSYNGLVDTYVRWWEGDFYIFRTYNKALDASEIGLNFNYDRDRFGLT